MDRESVGELDGLVEQLTNKQFVMQVTPINKSSLSRFGDNVLYGSSVLFGVGGCILLPFFEGYTGSIGGNAALGIGTASGMGGGVCYGWYKERQDAHFCKERGIESDDESMGQYGMVGSIVGFCLSAVSYLAGSLCK
ncbi:MAG: hypothetical protein V1725_05290 [archaeon]